MVLTRNIYIRSGSLRSSNTLPMKHAYIPLHSEWKCLLIQSLAEKVGKFPCSPFGDISSNNSQNSCKKNQIHPINTCFYTCRSQNSIHLWNMLPAYVPSWPTKGKASDPTHLPMKRSQIQRILTFSGKSATAVLKSKALLEKWGHPCFVLFYVFIFDTHLSGFLFFVFFFWLGFAWL